MLLIFWDYRICINESFILFMAINSSFMVFIHGTIITQQITVLLDATKTIILLSNNLIIWAHMLWKFQFPLYLKGLMTAINSVLMEDTNCNNKPHYSVKFNMDCLKHFSNYCIDAQIIFTRLWYSELQALWYCYRMYEACLLTFQ